MNVKLNIDSQEVHKFDTLADAWWDVSGALKTLHDINPLRLAFVEQHTPLLGKRVLDLGCGGGIFAEALAKAGAKVTGVDVATEAIAVAKAHANASGLDIDYQCVPIEQCQVAPFDVITCMEMLEHVPHPQHILRECRRLLKPDGILFLSTINRTPKAYLGAIVAAEYVLNIVPRQTHDYQKFIKPSELAEMARQEGLEMIDLKGMHYNPFTRHASLCTSVSVNYLMALGC